MDNFALTDWIAIISALGMILSIIVTISTLIGRGQIKVASDVELKSDVKHIREEVDKTSDALNKMSEKIDGVDTRLVRVEESCKSAHHRIDTIDEKR